MRRRMLSAIAVFACLTPYHRFWEEVEQVSKVSQSLNQRD